MHGKDYIGFPNSIPIWSCNFDFKLLESVCLLFEITFERSGPLVNFTNSAFNLWFWWSSDEGKQETDDNNKSSPLFNPRPSDPPARETARWGQVMIHKTPVLIGQPKPLSVSRARWRCSLLPGGRGAEEGSLALRFCQLKAGGISGRLTSNCQSVGPLTSHENTAAVPCARARLTSTPTLSQLLLFFFNIHKMATMRAFLRLCLLAQKCCICHSHGTV